MNQTEKIIRERGNITYVTTVEQVLASDGKPAVLVSSAQSYLHPGASAPSVKATGRTLLRFSTPKPVATGFGSFYVGQWTDNVLSYRPERSYPPNMDESTYQDYSAWVEAFHQVYSES